MQKKGTLYIVTAASGAGKTSLAKALMQTMREVEISISHTTRPIRSGEKADQHYFFITPREFTSQIAAGAFLEYAQVFGHYYGTSRHLVEERLALGKDVILAIDWQGARQVRSQMDCVSIFLLPPSMAELRIRLEKREREEAEVIEQRLAVAHSEMLHYKEFDYIVINDKFEDALLDLQAIVHSQRLRLKSQMVRHGDLIMGLLGEGVKSHLTSS